jgi:hydrogenase nickel incorporation protein HypA/HybF
MHELSIALELVELASTEAGRLGDVRVVAVHIRAGPLSGIVHDALRFSFDLATAGTIIEGARLEILSEDVIAWCVTCAVGRELADVQHRRCPVCGGFTPDLLSGDSLELAALEVADHAPSNR